MHVKKKHSDMAFLFRALPFLGGATRSIGSVLAPVTNTVSSMLSPVTNALGGMFSMFTGGARRVGSAVSGAAGFVGQGFSFLTSPIVWLGGGALALVLLLRK